MELKEYLSTRDKALEINLDESRYGTFAEIGAGQEVARHFFQAGRASKTIAKTMSAYDMTFSDEIYGKEESGRYVCESRLNKMLTKEFSLLDKRLTEKRGSTTCFFAYANTVATSSHVRGGRCHGWMGVRFQDRPGEKPNDIVIHVTLLDYFRLQQQEALGTLGVNLVHASLLHHSDIQNFVSSLKDGLGIERIEIDMVRFSGPALSHIDNRLVNLELLKQQLSPAIMFDTNGEIIQAAEALYGRPVLIQRGTFRPITKTNLDLTKYGTKQAAKQGLEKQTLVLMEMTMDNLAKEGDVDTRDFLNRVDTLGTLKQNVLVSNFFLYYKLKAYLRRCTSDEIILLIGATQLENLFDESYYKDLKGGTLEALGQLFDPKTRLYVFPYKTDKLCMTSKTFKADVDHKHLFKHLTDNGFIVDISECDDLDTSVHSQHVRELLEKGDPHWESLVPSKVRDHIKEHKLFGYKE